MKLLSQCSVFLFVCSGCFGQVTQKPATPDELQYFRFMLMNLASVDHDPAAIKMFEDSLVKQFGLNTQESAVIHAKAQSLNALLKQHRQSAQATLRGKKTLAPSDAAALSALDQQREQVIANLSNEILNAVRPETAGRLRAPGQIAATTVKKSQGIN